MRKLRETPEMLRAKALVAEVGYEASGQYRFETRGGVKMSMKIMEPKGVEDYKKYPLLIAANAHDSDGEPRPETLEMLVIEDQPTIIESLAYFARNHMYEAKKAKRELPELLEALADALEEESKPPTPARSKWKLVNEEGLAKVAGDMCEDPGGDRYEIVGFQPPHKPESTGRVEVTNENGFTQLFYPSVVGLKYVEVTH